MNYVSLLMNNYYLLHCLLLALFLMSIVSIKQQKDRI